MEQIDKGTVFDVAVQRSNVERGGEAGVGEQLVESRTVGLGLELHGEAVGGGGDVVQGGDVRSVRHDGVGQPAHRGGGVDSGGEVGGVVNGVAAPEERHGAARTWRVNLMVGR